jgi:CTP synthase
VIPHITDEIKRAVDRAAETSGADVVITEIGGTVGDIESLPFLEALRQYGFDKGRDHVMYIHLTLVPYLRAAGETKTKPTQQSVGKLREIGLMPDMLICRTSTPLSPENREKIALFCNVDRDSVIEERDVAHSIYEVPLVLRDEGVLDGILKRLGVTPRQPLDLSHWQEMVDRLIHPEREIDIAVVGKYINLQDAYKSIYEALTHAGVANHARVNIHRIESEELIDNPDGLKKLEGVAGILVPGGFGMRGVEGKIEAIRYARENGIPYFGICLGMQCAVIEFARNVAGLEGAASAEFEPDSPHPVIDLMEDQREVTMRGGTMRLGGYDCVLTPGTKAAASYDADKVIERHRHRYEFNNAYRDRLAKAGLVFSGLSPDGNLVEMIELPDHPWFVAGQFHPEFQSKLTDCHPLFRDFVSAALAHTGVREETPAAETTAVGKR